MRHWEEATGLVILVDWQALADVDLAEVEAHEVGRDALVRRAPAAEDARLSFPEVSHGIPPTIVLSHYRYVLPAKILADLVFTGRELSGREALAAGLPVSCLPGPSAVTTALAVSGLPSDRFCFEGFAPRKPGERRRWLAVLAPESRTCVFFESPRRLPESLRALAQLAPDRPAAVCRELTKRFEEVVRGPAAEVAERFREAPKGEVTVVLGPGAAESEPRLAEAVEAVLGMAAQPNLDGIIQEEVTSAPKVMIRTRKKTIVPRSTVQTAYMEALARDDMIFALGPAGTGKTYLAMGAAVQALRNKQVDRLILTRPAVEAGERLGFLPGTLHEKIDPYLKPLWDALHDMMEAEELLAHVDRGTIEVAPLAYMRGRAQPVTESVLTPQGWRPIGELAVDDEVIGSDGTPTKVLGVYPQGVKDIYGVFTQDGASTLATGDHLWSVHTRDDRRRGKPARVLRTEDMIGRLRAAHYHRYELPLVSAPVAFPARDVPMDPYALGLLLGDACLTGSPTPSLVVAGWRDHGTAEDPSLLRQLGLWGTRSATKFVPTDYLYNTPDVRLAVLQGLLDSEGGPVPQRGRTCRIQYSTTSPLLRDDALFLVRSLGGVAYWRSREDAYILDLRLPPSVQPFRLARKQQIYDKTGGGRPQRYIHAIEPAGTAEAVCIRVAAPDSLYVTEDFLVTHNTLNNAFIVADEAQNTTAEQMKMFLTRIGFNSKAVVTGDISQVDLPTGKRSGLKIVRDILMDIDGVAFCYLSAGDVVRHHIVQRIVEAYERFDEEQERQAGPTDADRQG